MPVIPPITKKTIKNNKKAPTAIPVLLTFVSFHSRGICGLVVLPENAALDSSHCWNYFTADCFQGFPFGPIRYLTHPKWRLTTRLSCRAASRIGQNVCKRLHAVTMRSFSGQLQPHVRLIILLYILKLLSRSKLFRTNTFKMEYCELYIIL